MAAFRPLLAVKLESFDDLRYPVMASPKLDGIRCCVLPRKGAATRKLKVIPNYYVREYLSCDKFWGLDGELITYTKGVADDFNTVQSKIMSHIGEPDFVFWVFDCFDTPYLPFLRRYETMVDWLNELDDPKVQSLYHDTLETKEQLVLYEEHSITSGAEGVMLRAPAGRYKLGRSTEREGILFKVIRRQRDEARVVGTVELMTNTNELEENELGLAKRSHKKAGLIQTGKLGALACDWNGVPFEIGAGFTEAQRREFWQGASLNGRLVTFEYRGVGSKGAPRFPVFVGFRPEYE